VIAKVLPKSSRWSQRVYRRWLRYPSLHAAVIFATPLLMHCQDQTRPPPLSDLASRSAQTASIAAQLPTRPALPTLNMSATAPPPPVVHPPVTAMLAGLEIALPEVEFRDGMLRLGVRLANRSVQPLRFYFIEQQVFRPNLQVYVMQDGKSCFDIQVPRGHGYIVTERDFPQLAPGAELRFEQQLSNFRCESSREVAIQVVYTSDVREWRGGVQTFDGPTKQLFGNGVVPNAWLGKIEIRKAVRF
jgi:hypothetical protein